MNKIDKFTYGSSPAAIRLAELLNEYGDPKVAKRVGKIYGKTCNGFDTLMHMRFDSKDARESRETLMTLWRDSHIESANRLPERIASYLVNLIMARHRWARRIAKSLDEFREALAKRKLCKGEPA